MFKSALLALKPTSPPGALIDSAVALAARQGLELGIRAVIDRDRIVPREPVPIGGAALKLERDEALMDAARQGAHDLIVACQAACDGRGVPNQALVCDGETVEQLTRQVQEFDVVLLGHGGGDESADEPLLRSILKHSPRPAVVFRRQPVAGENVVVAYDGSHQAARTLASLADSGFAAGRVVHVVTCHADSEQGRETAASACRFLARRGIRAEAFSEPLARSLADELLDQAQRHSAGLLVMGAFGKSAVREFILGSVTRAVLHKSPVPLFLDH
jgi:nucleotide-binding universal stress UspA family protein